MKLKIGRYEFDWWTQFIRNIEGRRGAVALGVRHKSGELEVLDACATNDMNQMAQGLLESARRYRDTPRVRWPETAIATRSGTPAGTML